MADEPQPSAPEHENAPPQSVGASAPEEAIHPPAGGLSRVVAFLAATVAGLIAWGIAETPVVRVAPKESNLTVMGQVTATIAATPESIREAERITAVRGLGVFGAILGLTLGLVSAWKGGNARTAAIAGGVGLVAGGLLGAVAPLGAMPLYEAIRTPGKQEILPSLLMHVALWAPVGAATGLAFALGRTTAPAALIKSGLAGAIGAALGAVAFQLVGSLAFPMGGVEKVVATTRLSRLVAMVIVAEGVGLLAGSSLAEEVRPARSRGPVGD